MSEEQFTTTLREFVHRKPFVPFFVELTDGQRIIVDYPSVAFSGGAAGFIDEQGLLIRFACEQVQSINLANAETTA